MHEATPTTETPVGEPTAALRRAVKTMAVFEASKGLLALLGLLGLLSLLHHDLHRLALDWIGHFGLSPDTRLGTQVMHGVDKLDATPTRTVVALGFAYVAARWIEAWGLWHDKAWGEWFAAISGAIYVPVEVQHVLQHRHWQGVLVLVFNVVLVIVLLVRLWQRKQANAPFNKSV